MDKHTGRHRDRKTNRQTDSRLSFQPRSFLPYLLPSDSLTPLASGLSAYGLTLRLGVSTVETNRDRDQDRERP